MMDQDKTLKELQEETGLEWTVDEDGFFECEKYGISIEPRPGRWILCWQPSKKSFDTWQMVSKVGADWAAERMIQKSWIPPKDLRVLLEVALRRYNSKWRIEDLAVPNEDGGLDEDVPHLMRRQTRVMPSNYDEVLEIVFFTLRPKCVSDIFSYLETKARLRPFFNDIGSTHIQHVILSLKDLTNVLWPPAG